MTKILIVNLHYKTGGIKKTLQELVRELKDRYEISILFFVTPSDFSGLEDVDILPAPFFLDTYITPKDELKKKKKYALRFFLKAVFTLLAKLVGNERVIHMLARISKKVTADVAISYTHDIWGEKGYFSGGTNYFVERKVSAKRKIAWIHGEPHTIGLTEKRAVATYRNFDYIVNVSNACKREFDAIFPNQQKSVYVRNLFDVDNIRQRATEPVEINADKMTFVTVSRLSASAKRVDKVNEIAKKLKEKGKLFNWYVVGDGPEHEAYISTSIRYQINDCVHYVGHQENPYKYIKNSDMLVVTSDSEAYPTVVIEALICGKPVLTTDFNAAQEMVINGVTGIISSKEPDRIFEKMLEIFDHPWTLQLMANNVRKNAILNTDSLRELHRIIEG